MRHSRCPMWAAVFGASAVLVGCGQKQEPVAEPDPNAVAARDVAYLGLAYIDFLANKQTSPKSLKDLEPKRATLGKLPEQIQDGRFVVIWSAALAAGQTSDAGYQNDKVIIGYEKNAAEEGGLVLFGGGKVKKLTAEAFKKEKVAKKKR